MDPDIIIPKNNSASNISDDNEQQNTSSSRMYDFTEDGIAPVTDDNLAPFVPVANKPKADPISSLQGSEISSTKLGPESAQTTISMKPTDVSTGFTKPPKPSTKPYIPPDANLLDKKIGTFDTTPFSSSGTSRTITSGPISFSSDLINQAPKKPTTDSYREPIELIQKKPEPIIKAKFVRQQDQKEINQTSTVIPKATAPIQKSVPIPANLPTGDMEQNKQIPSKNTTTIVKPNKPAPIPIQNIQNIIDKNTKPTTSTPSEQTVFNQDIPEIKKVVKNENQEIKSMRTYESDVADVMSHNRTSISSIAIAESTKKSGEERISNTESSHVGKKIFLFLLSIIFIGGGAIGAYYLYSISAIAPVKVITQQQKNVQSIIPKESQVIISINDDLPITIRSKIQAEMMKSQTPNTVKEVILTIKNSSGSFVKVTGPEIIKIMDIGAPDTVIRSLTPDWMLGIYNDQNNEKTFFVTVTTNFFQNTFSGMLQWESVMADDIKQYLYSLAPKGIANIPVPNNSQSTSTASTTTNTQITSTTTDITPPLPTYLTLRGRFEDRIVKNKDVREFRTDTNQTIFLYSFIDNSHLVVTGNEATLSEILTRLDKQSLIR